MIPGKINLIEISPQNVYYKIILTDNAAFWNPVQNGYDIALALESPIPQFMGYILYDSKYQNHNREIIFYNINQNGLIFYYTLISVSPESLKLNFQINNQTQIQLSP